MSINHLACVQTTVKQNQFHEVLKLFKVYFLTVLWEIRKRSMIENPMWTWFDVRGYL